MTLSCPSDPTVLGGITAIQATVFNFVPGHYINVSRQQALRAISSRGTYKNFPGEKDTTVTQYLLRNNMPAADAWAANVLVMKSTTESVQVHYRDLTTGEMHSGTWQAIRSYCENFFVMFMAETGVYQVWKNDYDRAEVAVYIDPRTGARVTSKVTGHIHQETASALYTYVATGYPDNDKAIRVAAGLSPA